MLNRDTILEALRRLSERLEARGIVGELNLLNGKAMVLAFQARRSTKDVDAIFAPAGIIRDEARAVAEEMDLPVDWLNDAAKGFVSPKADFHGLADLDLSHLRVQVPTAEYLLADEGDGCEGRRRQRIGRQGGYPIPDSPVGADNHGASV